MFPVFLYCCSVPSTAPAFQPHPQAAQADQSRQVLYASSGALWNLSRHPDNRDYLNRVELDIKTRVAAVDVLATRAPSSQPLSAHSLSVPFSSSQGSPGAASAVLAGGGRHGQGGGSGGGGAMVTGMNPLGRHGVPSISAEEVELLSEMLAVPLYNPGG
jgi:hypothetical protein